MKTPSESEAHRRDHPWLEQRIDSGLFSAVSTVAASQLSDQSFDCRHDTSADMEKPICKQALTDLLPLRRLSHSRRLRFADFFAAELSVDGGSWTIAAMGSERTGAACNNFKRYWTPPLTATMTAADMIFWCPTTVSSAPRPG